MMMKQQSSSFRGGGGGSPDKKINYHQFKINMKKTQRKQNIKSNNKGLLETKEMCHHT